MEICQPGLPSFQNYVRQHLGIFYVKISTLAIYLATTILDYIICIYLQQMFVCSWSSSLSVCFSSCLTILFSDCRPACQAV